MRILVSFPLRVNVVRPHDSSGRFLPRSDSHQSTHDESAESPRMRNEPGSSSRDGQPSRVDAPDHAVIPGDVKMPGEKFEVGASDENPTFQRVPDQPSDENPSVEPQLQSPQSSESQLQHPRRRITTEQFARNVPARQSTSSVPLVPSSEAALAFSASSLELPCFVEQTVEKGLC